MVWIENGLYLQWRLSNQWEMFFYFKGLFFLGYSDSKEFAWNAEDLGLNPGSGRSSGEGHGYTLQYSCLDNYMDREAGGSQSMGSQRVRHDWVANT